MIIGAYAAAAAEPGGPEFTTFVQGLARDPRVTGLEIPSHHLLRADVEDTLFTHLPARWTSAVTCFPGTMLSLLADPRIGLASEDRTGRSTAIAQLASIREAVTRINGTDPGSAPRISDVFLHSAPRGGTVEALLASLTEITAWDWGVCRLDLEHCDAPSDGHSAEKGFLDLTAELDAIARCGGAVGVTVNWARSAIEARSADGPAQHVDLARNTGALRWLMLSGVADHETAFGSAWADAHLPVDTVEPSSLLTVSAIRRAIGTASPDTKLGLKVGLRPSSLDPSERVDRITACLDLVDRARSAASGP